MKLPRNYFLLLIVALFFSCSKEKTYPTYFLSQEFRDYIAFPIGSFWVYEDSINGYFDTVSITLQNIEMHDAVPSAGVPYNEEVIFQHTKSSFTNDTSIYRGGGGKIICTIITLLPLATFSLAINHWAQKLGGYDILEILIL